MKIVFLLIIIFTLWDCNSKKEDQGVNLGIRDVNGDTLSFTYFDPGNSDYDFYDSDRADSIFNNRTFLSKMPGQFVFGVKNKKGKPYRYLIFKKADTVLTIGKNYLDVSPSVKDFDPKYYPLPNELFHNEYSLTNFVLKVVSISYDTTGQVVRENQRLAAMDINTKDTILYQEEVFFIIKGKKDVVGGTFAVFDNRNTQKEMKELCENALKQAYNSIKKKPK